MFEKVPLAPPDGILGLTDAFRKDPNPDKVNLTVGVYQDASGRTPIFRCVKRAEQRLVERESSKSYLAIAGHPDFGKIVQPLLFGADHEVAAQTLAWTCQTPGGTGGLRVAADFLREIRPEATVWLSDPTWPNHEGIFQAAGLRTRAYPYFNPARNALDLEAMLTALRDVAPGDIVVLHGCCHNPTGIDPTPEAWRDIAGNLEQTGALPLVDFAYQGLGDGLQQDARALRLLARPGRELIVVSSFSKNFGLYNERVGALTVVCAQAEQVEPVASQVRARIRANYSNPPYHGAAIVATVLEDVNLRAEWEREVRDMRERIQRMRKQFVERLAAQGAKRDFSFLERQRGMFSYSGLNAEQVRRLRDEYAIYIVGSGRINVAGLTEDNLDRVCTAIAAVLSL